MNLDGMLDNGMLGLFFVVIFGIILCTIFSFSRFHRISLRNISAFTDFVHEVSSAIETGQRLHLTLGRGSLNGVQGASAFIGLSILGKIVQSSYLSDYPPLATSGDANWSILSEDTYNKAAKEIEPDTRIQTDVNQMGGFTPMSYASSTLPIIYDQHVSLNVLSGHFGSEVALITDAAERSGTRTLAGSDGLTAQAIIYSSVDDPLLGEELYAAGTYVQSGPQHLASLITQDVMRWILVLIILGGGLLHFLGILW